MCYTLLSQNSLANSYSYKIYNQVDHFPENWDYVSKSCIFLQKNYLQIVQEAAPENMQCSFIGIFEGSELIATSIIQEISLDALNSFGNRDNCLKNKIRDFLFKRFSSKLFILGNNMLSGQNAYAISPKANEQQVLNLLKKISNEWTKKAHIKLIKDFYPSDFAIQSDNNFQKDFWFSAQPSMIFELPQHWKNEQDYVNDLEKKYRDQYKRGRKKGAELVSKDLTLEEVQENQKLIHKLYLQVAQNAPVNTFFLPENHFYIFKKQLNDQFIIRGYYLKDQLVGFTSVIRHGNELETYFLGYNDTVQREYMLYLNMLYDILACGIHHSFKRIIFGRTALEIKSSIGALPVELVGFMRHTNPIIHLNLPWIFPLLEPKVQWNPRSPFKLKPQKSQLGILHLDEAIKKKQGSLCQFFCS